MSENLLSLIASLKIIWLAGFTLFYSSGGISGKWKRRIIGSGFLTLGVCGFSLWLNSFSFWFLLYWPLLFGGLSCGYGADLLKDKLLRRLRYGFCVGVAALPIALVSKMYMLFAFHIGLCMVASVLLGVWNPTANARDEETLIAALSGIVPLFLIGG
jgi:hypothetical protein